MPVDRDQLAQIIEWLSVLATRHPNPERRAGGAALARRLGPARQGLAVVLEHAPAVTSTGTSPTVTLSTLCCRDISGALDDVRPLIEHGELANVSLFQIALDLSIPSNDWPAAV